MITNKEIIDSLLLTTGCKDRVELASYLTEKYNQKITKQNINQFEKPTKPTITGILLRESLEKYN